MFDDGSLIGDPSQFDNLGVVVMAGMKAAAAFFCLAAAQAAGRVGASRARIGGAATVWQVFAIVLLVFSILTLLNGDTMLTEYVRNDARDEGWYNIRRYLQFTFLAVALPVGYKVYQYIERRVQREDQDLNTRLALRGILLQTLVAVIQTVSWHYTDEIMNLQLPGMSVATFLSAVAMLTIMFAAFRDIARLSRISS